jgi:hypothetical protein
MLSDASHNVDTDGNVTNKQTRQLIRQFLEALAGWTVRIKRKATVNQRSQSFCIDTAKP